MCNGNCQQGRYCDCGPLHMRDVKDVKSIDPARRIINALCIAVAVAGVVIVGLVSFISNRAELVTVVANWMQP